MSADVIKEIGVIFVPIMLAIIGLINIWLSQKVHKIVNSAMTQEKTENAMLRGLLTVKQLEVDSAEKARVQLATETAAGKASIADTIKIVNEPTEPVPTIIVP